MRRIVPIFMIVALAVLSMPSVFVHAAEGLEVTPSTIEKRVDPGTSLTQTVKIHNPGKTVQTFYPQVRDIAGNDESGAPIFVDQQHTERIGAELSSWSTLSVTQLTVDPGKDGELTLTIQIPANAPIGGAFGAVIFATEPPQLNKDQSAVAIGYSVGTLVAIRVGDNGSDDAIIREFRSDKALYGGPAATFTTRVENRGTALARPYGEIQIFDTFGRFTASVSFNPGLGGLLPKQLRQYTTQWAGSGFALGRYHAKLIATYGDSVKKSLMAETSFWILPGKLTAYVLGGAVLLFLIVYFWIRSYIRRALRRSGSSDAPVGRPISFVAVFIAIVAVAAIVIGVVFFLLA